MATKINPTQLTLTGSSANALGAAGLTDSHNFLVHTTDGTAVQTISAAFAQNYFGDPDVTAGNGSDSMKIAFVSGSGDRKEVFVDSGTGLSYVPSTDTLTAGVLSVTGDASIGDDLTLGSDAALITLGNASNSAQVILTHVSAAIPALRVQSGRKISFGDEDVFLRNSSDGTLVVQGDSQVDINSTGDITADAGGTLSLQGGAASDLTTSAGNLSLINSSADSKILIQSAITGSAVGIHIDGNSAAGSQVDIDAGTLTIDTTGTAIHTIGGAFTLDGASTVAIDGVGGINIGTADSGAAISIGHTTSEVTVNDNLTVTGDLTVNGTTTTVDTTNLQVEDALIILGSGSSGEAASSNVDLGLIFAISGTTNPAIYWDASEGEFAFVRTEHSGTVGSGAQIVPATYHAVRAGSLVLDDAGTIGNNTLADIITFNSDGDTTFKDGAYDVNIASHDGTNGLALGGTIVTSLAGELNRLDGYAAATFSNTADSIVFSDADASTGGGDVRHVTTANFLTAIAGDGLEVASSQLKVDQKEEFFQSSSMTTGLTASLAVNHTQQLTQSLQVFLNGVLQQPSGTLGLANAGDYKVQSDAHLCMNTALDGDDVLTVRYIKK